MTAATPSTWMLDRHAGKAGWRRVLLALLVLGTAAFGGFLMWTVLGSDGFKATEVVFFAIFVVMFAWIAISFWSGFFGFVLGVLRLHPLSLRRAAPADGPIPELHERTAILMPVYNEDPADVFARLEANYRSLEATGRLASFDFFVLSDTRDAEIAREEGLAWSQARETLQAGDRLFYRRRENNAGKKAGNIAEWVQTRGADYAHMIILDADSTMQGDALVRLAALMEASPRTGIIQTHIVPAGRETLFARALQFSTRVTGAVLAVGHSFWQLGEANYYGHNAILRVAAFAQSCRLPVLSGKPPLGGHILSHDQVEAAMMRAGGWDVRVIADEFESWEENPPSLPDFIKRDLRWCQGNMQYLRLIGRLGLKPMGRFQLVNAVFMYLGAPFWVLMLAAGLAGALRPASSTAGGPYPGGLAFALY
ncbi:MAG TPA: glucans biosynthesis glucosyltransferase MdoH, partial [Acetobacteraceae bacterium]|nr:glucans biosynthesis glucosyltransferase MdoH [Acetobacteraceae bacterium]